VISTTVALTPTSTISESIQLFLPENLFAQTTNPFSMPVTITLQMGDSFKPATVSITETDVLVRGISTATGPDLLVLDQGTGAYLWQQKQNHDSSKNAVRPRGDENNSSSYVLIRDGDQVRILGGAGDFYHVRIVKNQADETKAEGQTGWVRKDLIHGQ
jgi:hypothetical protein